MSDYSQGKPATADQVTQLLTRIENLADEIAAMQAHRSQGVQLGYRALIAIAFVVWIFGNVESKETVNEIHILRREVKELRKEIDARNEELRERAPQAGGAAAGVKDK